MSDTCAADPSALAEQLSRTPVDVLKIVPSHLEALLSGRDPGQVLPREVLILGGERALGSLVDKVRALRPDLRIFNHYGPSETCVGVLSEELPPNPQHPRPDIPLGSPLPGTRVVVVDPNGETVPRGVPGELWIGGRQLARGYLGQPAATAAHFIPAEQGGGRRYRSGDRVLMNERGQVEFLGRLDDQIKIRGVRIELGEIESTLAEHPAVRAAAARFFEPKRDASGEAAELIGYVVTTAEPKDVLAWLGGRLPPAMLPARLVGLASLPLNANGKVDRTALAKPAEEEENEFSAPRGDSERQVASIFSDLLRRERVSATSDFFHLGGHSLLATQAVARLREAFGSEIPLATIFEHPTVRGLARELDTGRAGRKPPSLPPLVPISRQEHLPLSFAQRRLWLLDRLEPESGPAYVIPMAVRIEGRLDTKALHGTLEALVRRHEILRTTVEETSEGPVQKVTECHPVMLDLVELESVQSPEGDLGLRHLLMNRTREPFDLASGPLLRTTLIRRGADDHVLFVVCHHIVFDAWSRGVLFRELSATYSALSAGRASPLSPLDVQYADFAAWQRGWLRGAFRDAQLDYWREALGGAPAVHTLPTDRPRPPRPTYRGAQVRVALPADLAVGLEALAESQGATLYMVLLAGLFALLHRLSRAPDVVVGTAIANRRVPKLESLVGFFTNTLVLRSQVEEDLTFEELLGRVRTTALAAYGHQDLPFEDLVEELAPDRNLAIHPVFQVFFALHNTPQEPLRLEGVTLSPLEAEVKTSKFDLSLLLHRSDEGVVGRLEYASDLFEEATVSRWAKWYVQVMSEVVRAPEICLSEIPLSRSLWGPSGAHGGSHEIAYWEQNQSAKRNMAGEQTRWMDPSVVSAFEVEASRHWERTAVRVGEESLSYGSLNERSNRLAHRLRELGVKRESRVGLSMGRGLSEWVGMLGVWKSGGAYVPIPPELPKSRKSAMILGSGVELVLTCGGDSASSLPSGVERLRLDEGRSYSGSSEGLGVPVSGENLAYVMYTSGSTGSPKGVGVSHRALLHLLFSMGSLLGLSRETVFLSVTTLGFDISLLERWGPLLYGGQSVLASASESTDGVSLGTLARSRGANVLQATPSTYRLLEASGWVGDKGLTVVCGGEALPSDLSLWLQGRSASVWNVYGPTETTVWSTAHRLGDPEGSVPAPDAVPGLVPGSVPGSVPIGRGIGETYGAVVDGFLRPVPLGVWGELVIGGPGVARGYEGNASETAHRFVPDVLWSSGGRLYRSGDVCRLRADGVLEYGGRRDAQVKVRGHRIELGDVESALVSDADVSAGAVVVVGEGSSSSLAAFVVGRPGRSIEGQDVRRGLGERLPGYMVPARVEVVSELPLTPNGKVDRGALRRWLSDGAGRVEVSGAPPEGDDEKALAAIWSEVLGVASVSREANFFELGGHSLLATQAVVRIRERLGVELGVRALFESPTVAGLASEVRSLRAGGVWALGKVGVASRPAELPLSFAQERLWFMEQLSPRDPAYVMPLGLRLEGRLCLESLERALLGVVGRHESLRTTFASVEGRAVQEVHDELRPDIHFVDVSTSPWASRDSEAAAHLRSSLASGFDLARGPLLRLTVVRHSESVHLALLLVHHIVSDGWSTTLLARELTALYAAEVSGSPSPLAPLPIQYADWALYERRTLSPQTLEGDLEYWRSALAGAPVQMLRPDRPGAEHVPAAAGFSLGTEATLRLEKIAQQQGASLFMVCLAAFQLLLARENGTEDIVVGTDVAHRTHRETEALIGFFVNLLVLRTRMPAPDASFETLVARVREVCLSAFRHQHLPFSKLAQELSRGPSFETAGAPNPLFQVLFVFQNLPSHRLLLPELEARPLELVEPTAKFDVALFLRPGPHGLRGTWRFDQGRFLAARIERLSKQLQTLLEFVAGAPHTQLALLARQDTTANEGRAMRKTRRLERLRHVSVRPVAPEEKPLVVEKPLRSDRSLPYLIEATGPNTDLESWAQHHRDRLDRRLSDHGAILFRGGGFHKESSFARMARTLCGDLFSEYGDLPRSSVAQGIYGSTPYPSDRAIEFHNESSHLNRWPGRIVFGCVEPPTEGGETPLADGRKVLAALEPSVRRRFEDRGLAYIRNFVPGLDVSWQDFFGTESAEAVERRCQEAGMAFSWMDGGGLRIRQFRPAITVHPKTYEAIWFNQIALHHAEYLDPSVRESLLQSYGEEGLPRHVTFGDGSRIEDSDLEAVQRAYAAARVEFSWHKGDVVLLDNMLVAHGRNPFAGRRRVIVAMGEIRNAGAEGENS